MLSRHEFSWGRWIRLSDAHHYLGVDRRWFNLHVRPYCPIMKLSKQARAIRREDLDTRAARLEQELLGNALDPGPAVREDFIGDGRPVVEKKDTKVWAKPERVASPVMPMETRSSTSRSTEKASTPVSELSVRSKRKHGSRTKSNVSGSQRNVDRVLALLSEKPHCAT